MWSGIFCNSKGYEVSDQALHGSYSKTKLIGKLVSSIEKVVSNKKSKSLGHLMMINDVNPGYL